MLNVIAWDVLLERYNNYGIYIIPLMIIGFLMFIVNKYVLKEAPFLFRLNIFFVLFLAVFFIWYGFIYDKIAVVLVQAKNLYTTSSF